MSDAHEDLPTARTTLRARYGDLSAALVALAALAPLAGATSFAADQERHVVVSGTDLNGPLPSA